MSERIGQYYFEVVKDEFVNRGKILELGEQRIRIIQAEDRLKSAVANLPAVRGVAPIHALLNKDGIMAIQTYLHEQDFLSVDIAVVGVRINTVRGFSLDGDTGIRVDLQFPEIQKVKSIARPIEEPNVGIYFDGGDDNLEVIGSHPTTQFYAYNHPNVALREQAEERMTEIRDKFIGTGKTDELLGVIDAVSAQIEQGNARRGIKPWRDERRYKERMAILNEPGRPHIGKLMPVPH